MISFNNLSKGYGSRLLFDSVTFTLGTKERIGLVGRNGHGKTTLLNIIAGLDLPDSGEIIKPNGYTVGYLKQTIEFRNDSVRKEAIASLPKDREGEDYFAEKVLSGLGFNNEHLDLHPTKLSGGYQVRLNLAKLLISEPDLLLLDEPTNYLDILSVRWLRSFLSTWQGELLIVTHDRLFMDSVVTHIAGIHRQKIKKIAGQSQKYYESIAQSEEIYEKARIKDEAKRKDMQKYIDRFRAKASHAVRVQSRLKTMSKMEKNDRLAAVEELEFSFNYKEVSGDNILQVQNISFAYPDGDNLIDNLSFTLEKKDRICIIGPNGSGKSTLLKLLSGDILPTNGDIYRHNHAEVGYFEQSHINTLSAELTVEEEISQAGGYSVDRKTVRSICASMMFSGESALKKISVLSGGEKCRVMLGKIISKPVSYLLLDEPTNHLDMDACDSLLDAIDSFEGAAIIVTHDESYLNYLANKLIVFQGDKPFIFDGTYQEFLNKIGWDGEEKDKVKSVNKRKEDRVQRAKFINSKNSELKPLRLKAESLELSIIDKEEELTLLFNQIQDAADEQDGLLIAELGRKGQNIEKEIEQLYHELDIAYRELEEVEKKFML